MQAIRRLGEDDEASRTEHGADGPLAGAGLAEQVAAARAEMMAEGLTLQDAARRCAALPGFCDDPRWPALARLEGLYQEILAQAGDDGPGRRPTGRAGRIHCPAHRRSSWSARWT